MDANRTCPTCLAVFADTGGKNKHVRRNVCKKTPVHLLQTVIIDDPKSKEVINALTDESLKFHCAQSMGQFIENFYPLVFSRKRSKDLQALGDKLPFASSPSILRRLITKNKGQPIKIYKDILLNTPGLYVITN